MDGTFWVSSVLLGLVTPVLVQVFKTHHMNWNFWAKLGLALGVSTIVGVANAYINGAFIDGIVDYKTLSQSVVAVITFGQAFFKTTFESYFAS